MKNIFSLSTHDFSTTQSQQFLIFLALVHSHLPFFRNGEWLSFATQFSSTSHRLSPKKSKKQSHTDVDNDVFLRLKSCFSFFRISEACFVSTTSSISSNDHAFKRREVYNTVKGPQFHPLNWCRFWRCFSSSITHPNPIRATQFRAAFLPLSLVTSIDKLFNTSNHCPMRSITKRVKCLEASDGKQRIGWPWACWIKVQKVTNSLRNDTGGRLEEWTSVLTWFCSIFDFNFWYHMNTRRANVINQLEVEQAFGKPSVKTSSTSKFDSHWPLLKCLRFVNWLW